MHIQIAAFPELEPQTEIVVMVGDRSSDHLKELARMIEQRGRTAYRIEQAGELLAVHSTSGTRGRLL